MSIGTERPGNEVDVYVLTGHPDIGKSTLSALFMNKIVAIKTENVILSIVIKCPSSPFFQPESDSNRTISNVQCVFWDIENDDESGDWSTEGCRLTAHVSDSGTVECQCDHLTNFAILVVSK